MASDTVSIPRDQLNALVAEHKAAKELMNIFFNPGVDDEVKFDYAARLSHLVVLTDRTIVKG